MKLNKCRICKKNLKKILNLGKITLVGEFPIKKKKLKKYNISLNYCKICKHVQIAELINPNKLFKNYLWETGVSSTNIKLIEDIVKKLKKYDIGKKSKVLEIACNDGSFLNILQKKVGCFSAGIDPAQNLSKKNKSKKIIRLVDYFNKKSSNKIKKKYGKFDFLFARNVLAHVKDPNVIFAGAKNVMSTKGVFIIEAPSLLNILKFNQYDNIFHEHIGFHSLKSVLDLSKSNKLKVIDIEKIESQGGSLRYFITHFESDFKISKKVDQFLKYEIKNKLFNEKNLLSFRNKINNHRKILFKFLKNLKDTGKKISVYGASGKGQALMQYCKIDSHIVDFCFDRSKLKQKKFTPGTNIKIIDPSLINQLPVNYLLLLSWNLKKEILKQQKKFVSKGGKFIVPFHRPRIEIK